MCAPARPLLLCALCAAAVAFSPVPRPRIPSSLSASPATEENVRAALDEFRRNAVDMLGCHPAAAAIGITGDVALAHQEGPFCELALEGRFWHRRATVLRRAEAHLRARIPELIEVTVADPAMLLDAEFDEMTGVVIADHRAPDYNGDRATLEYQGIDPDERGPFSATGGLRPGGSMFS